MKYNVTQPFSAAVKWILEVCHHCC